MLRIAYTLSVIGLISASAITAGQIEDRGGRLSAGTGLALVAMAR